MAATDIQAINEMVERESLFVRDLLKHAAEVIVGQKGMLESLLVGLLTDGHVLLEGVPGLAKTTAIRTLSALLNVGFRRIQFTPDLLPADLVGTMVYDQKTGGFEPKKGPIFTNLVLADEINRAPAKVQSALLECMQERQVTLGDTTHLLEDPFLVMATQNPIEQEGTYPLPEAQVDRFMLKVKVGYPTKEEERLIMDRVAGGTPPFPTAVAGPPEIFRARDAVRRIYIDPKIRDYIVNLVFATRNPEGSGIKKLSGLIEYGASPRASIYLNLAAKAHAFLRRRGYVTPEDVKAVGLEVLRHRVIVTYEAEAEEVAPEDVVREVFDHVEVP